MGGQISVPEGAKDRNKEVYGPFALRQSQKYSLDVLSELIGTLLRENNLFDLKEVLNTKTGCESLIVVVKDKLEKEFTTLQFPDPIRKTDFSPVGFVSKKEYNSRATKEDFERSRAGKDRDVYCHSFAVFIIRFTILLSAVIASVAFQRNVFKKLLNSEAVGTSVTSNKKYKLLKDSSVYFGAISPDIIKELTEGSLQKIPDDPRNIYIFNKDDPIVIDTSKGIVYNAERGPTAVFGIKMSRYTAPQGYGMGYGPGYGMGVPGYGMGYIAPTVAPAPPVAPAPAAPVGPAPAPTAAVGVNPHPQSVFPQQQRRDSGLVGRNDVSVASSNVSGLGRQPLAPASVASGSTVKTRTQRRKGRRATRRRRQYGGADEFLVSLYTTVNCQQVGCRRVVEFITDKNGMTRSLSGDSTLITFSQRVANALNGEPTKIPLLEDTYENKFHIFNIDDSFSIMDDYKEAILGKKNDITSPAFYRATLLAAGVDERTVSTYFCSDAWTGVMTDTVPYALLQSLYYDMDQDFGKMSPSASAELQQTVKQFVGNTISRPVDVSSTAPPSEFSHLQFIAPKDIAKEFCKVTTGVRNTTLPQQRTILTNAHRTLRDLYDNHLENIVKFIRKVLTLKEVGYGKPVAIRINPVFFTDTRGAAAVLEILIREARTMLSAHYLQVETVYKKAVADIAALGNTYTSERAQANVVAAPKPNVANPSEVRRPLERGPRGPQNANPNNII